MRRKPTVSGFLEANEEFAKNADVDDDPAIFWTNHVKEVVTDLNASIVSLKVSVSSASFYVKPRV